jgi:EF-hand domain-containing protein 1
MKKMFKQDMHILRFDAKLISTEPDDESRKFIISFYCGDDTIQVYEICDKNSGRIGGKFMERKKHNNPVNKEYYIEKDFLIGRTIFLGGYKFQLLKADEYTEKYMEDNPDIFKEASLENILNKIKKGHTQYKSLQEYAIALIAFLDKRGEGAIPFEDFINGLKA